jgi:hypothetical protein
LKILLRAFDSVPTAGAAGTAQCKVNKAIQSPKCEITETFAELVLTAKSATTASAFTAADIDTLLAALVSKIRVTQNGDDNSVSIAPKLQRRLVAKMIGRDPAVEHFAAGAAINASGGANLTYIVPIVLPRWVADFDHKNVLAASGRQVNREEWYLDMPAGWNAIALAGAAITLNVSALAINLYATRLQKEREEEFVGPSIIMRTRSWTSNPETEEGPFFDIVFALASIPATEDTNLGTINVVQAGEAIGKLVAPSSLARAAVCSAFPQDGVRPLDITAGASGITPLVCVNGAIAADESEWPVVQKGESRTLESTTVSGAVNETVVSARISDMYSPTNQAFVSDLLKETGRSGLQFEQLAVKGGGAPNNGKHSRFKPRWLAPPSQKAA